jgi:phosphoribosylaminoimidazole-succinocarboxamide synthase
MDRRRERWIYPFAGPKVAEEQMTVVKMPELVAFRENPRWLRAGLDERELAALHEDAVRRFDELPLVHRGESSELRRAPAPGILIQRLIPSLNSASQRRKGQIEGTVAARLATSCVLWRRLHRRGLATCYLTCDGAHLLVTEERVPPVEVIVKAALIGTPTRRYRGLFEHRDRHGRPFVKNAPHDPYVRFDYRNPAYDAAGHPVHDECLPLGLADRFIETRAAERTALEIFALIQESLRAVQLAVLDACFVFDETGRVLCYELSPDNMRIKRAGWAAAPRRDDEFDKDLWRDHAEDEQLLQQWATLARMLQATDDGGG